MATQPSCTVAAALTQGVTARIAVTSNPSQTSSLHPKPLSIKIFGASFDASSSVLPFKYIEENNLLHKQEISPKSFLCLLDNL